MDFKAIQNQAGLLHAKAAQTKPKIVRAAGLRWSVEWNGNGFTCTPTTRSNLYPVNFNTRSQAQAGKWLREQYA